MKFQINITTGNAALADDPAGELSTILDDIKSKLTDVSTSDRLSGRVRDSNGNNVGSWEYDPDA